MGGQGCCAKKVVCVVAAALLLLGSAYAAEYPQIADFAGLLDWLVDSRGMQFITEVRIETDTQQLFVTQPQQVREICEEIAGFPLTQPGAAGTGRMDYTITLKSGRQTYVIGREGDIRRDGPVCTDFFVYRVADLETCGRRVEALTADWDWKTINRASGAGFPSHGYPRVQMETSEPVYFAAADGTETQPDAVTVGFIGETGSLYVPLRDMAERLHYTVDWDAKQGWAVVSKYAALYYVEQDVPQCVGMFESMNQTRSTAPVLKRHENGNVTLNPEAADWVHTYALRSAPVQRDGRIYVPLRDMATALGYDVQWDAAHNRAAVRPLDVGASLDTQLELGRNVDGSVHMRVGVTNVSDFPVERFPAISGSPLEDYVYIYEGDTLLHRIRNMGLPAILYPGQRADFEADLWVNNGLAGAYAIQGELMGMNLMAYGRTMQEGAAVQLTERFTQ